MLFIPLHTPSSILPSLLPPQFNTSYLLFPFISFKIPLHLMKICWRPKEATTKPQIFTCWGNCGQEGDVPRVTLIHCTWDVLGLLISPKFGKFDCMACGSGVVHLQHAASHTHTPHTHMYGGGWTSDGMMILLFHACCSTITETRGQVCNWRFLSCPPVTK